MVNAKQVTPTGRKAARPLAARSEVPDADAKIARHGERPAVGAEGEGERRAGGARDTEFRPPRGHLADRDLRLLPLGQQRAVGGKRQAGTWKVRAHDIRMVTHNPPDVPERRQDEAAVWPERNGLDRAVLVDEGETHRRGHRGAVAWGLALVGEAYAQRENSDRPAGGVRRTRVRPFAGRRVWPRPWH